MNPTRIDSLKLADYLRAGDTVAIAQGCGEPLSLTEALVAQRESVSGIRVLLCTLISKTFRPEHTDHLRFLLTGVTGASRRLADTGKIDLLPSHYSDLERLFKEGLIKADVVMVQVSPPDAEGLCSPGVNNDYLLAAMKSARIVIAEVNQQVPDTYGQERIPLSRFDCVVESDRPLCEAASGAIGETDHRIARQVAELIDHRATLQLGIGGIPDSIATALGDHRGLGFHSGMMSDRVIDLIESGVIDNAHKGVDPGVSVTGVLIGTRRLFDFAHRNPLIRLRSAEYTHSPRTFLNLKRLVSVNSAIEVDLTGQVNAEALDGRQIGAIGGQVDFVRGARLSAEGRSVIALASRFDQGGRSRIVNRLSGPVTTARADVDHVVTEWGVAHLRGLSIRERVRAMIDIAHPDCREQLARDSDQQGVR